MGFSRFAALLEEQDLAASFSRARVAAYPHAAHQLEHRLDCQRTISMYSQDLSLNDTARKQCQAAFLSRDVTAVTAPRLLWSVTSSRRI